ncbi:translocation/assembly module TamB domain-containing protein [Janthinobacterium sp. GW458P]|uniref:translocation/assembly module TamB domain-containing protein n=1 Tax=Janthinobacterium sp. GW458P TaxID=1981504 RepID=UPI000A32A18C|nr:translocation/assembly module TamB domain-containing protein [Janthinobacterium sp. GW458P]MBE3027494.1 translocation/assembly module TamB domain-containing protein [Janthinobacterium sp. GW458P]
MSDISTESHDAAPPPPAKKPRRWVRYVLIAVASLAVLLGAAFWFLGRESTLQMLVQKVASASGGDIAVSGVSGSLYNRMHLGHVSYRSKTQHITADNIDINWSPFQFFSEGIAISELHVASLSVASTAPSEEPSTMPASLAAPFKIGIADARLDKVTLVSAGGNTVFEKIHFTLSGDKSQWQLEDASAVTPFGQATASATIAATQPFKLSGKAALTQINPAAGEKPAALALQLGGDLNLLNVTAKGSAGAATADARLALAPFDPVIILRSASIRGRNINPGKFDATMPQADLSLELDAAIDTRPARQTVSGKLAILNHATPGPIDQQKLPLRQFEARLGGTLTATTLESAIIDFGNAGKFTGGGKLNRDAADAPIGTAQLALHTDKIDLQHMYSSINSTKIAGDIVLDSDGKTQTLRATLGEAKLRLDVEATLADSLVQLRKATLQAGKSSVNATGQISLKDEQPFKAVASASRLNPADFGAFPVADLNLDVRANGHVAPQWLANADVTVRPSKLLDQPLSGKGKLTADAAHFSGIDVQLALGKNNMTAKGNFGGAGEKLNWNVDARQLSALQGDLLGTVLASGVLQGTLQQPRTSFVADAKGLGLASGKRPAADSAIHASGDVGLTGPKQQAALKMTGSLQKINPAAFGASLPNGNVNADFNGSGRLTSDWQVALNLALRESTLQNAPLAGYAKLSANAQRIDSVDTELRLGPNSLLAKGALGGATDKLTWKLDAPQLSTLGPRFAGVLHAAGSVSGKMDAPAAQLTLDGKDLTFFGDQQLKAVKGSASVGAGQGALDPMVSSLEITGYATPTFKLASARLGTTGTRGSHTVSLTARNDDFDATVQVKGSQSGAAWTGTIDSLQNKGRYALVLQAPVPVKVAGAAGSGVAGLGQPEQISVGNTVIKLPAGSFTMQSLVKNGPRWTSSGQAAGVALTYLAQVIPSLQANARSDLTLGAQWSLDMQVPTAKQKDPSLAGMLHVYREKGDVTVGVEQPLALGLRTFDARVDVANQQLRLAVKLDGARAGQSDINATVQMLGGRISNDSALSLTGTTNIDSLAWLAPLTGQPGLELGGALKVALSGSGTIGAPQLNGDINGSKLLVNWADQGLKLRNGVLQAKLAGDQLQLQRLSFDGGDGKVQADGWVRFANGEASLELKLLADRLQALSRPDRTLVLSGNSTLVRNDKRFSFEGKFKANRALIELAPQDTPTQSSDVVVLGKEAKGGKEAPSLPLNIDLEFDLGNNFHLRGMGLDADLAGNVRARVINRAAPRVTGSIKVVTGQYAAYGQKLSIERGLIAFTGAYDNPSLNILAVRKRPEGEALSETNVEAGVEVRGTAQAPTAKLVSTPSVSDSDKLAWLILGHGAETAAGDEMALLTTAAGALFGGSGGGLQGKLANSLGLDEVGLSQAQGLESTVVTVGKRLSSRAYLTFEQGTSTATSLVKLRYKLNRRITLQFQTGTNNALDVLYTWAFD